MSGIYKSNTYLDKRSGTIVFSSLEEELLNGVEMPSLSTISITDSSNSDFNLDKNILSDISCFNEQYPHEISFNMIQLNQEQRFLGKNNHNMPSNSNTTCDNSLRKKHREKSVSLHDISNFPSLLSSNNNGLSNETLHSNSISSTVKSKDSGIHRSVSCLSLTSGNRSYEHVQSKVKKYIQDIKENEAKRKKNRLQITQSEKPVSTTCPTFEEPKELKKKIHELEFELKEKSILLDTQQVQYNALLNKYAEAKNIIDSIRLKGISINSSIVKDDSSASHFLHSTNNSLINSTNLSGKYVNNLTNNTELDGSKNAESLFNNVSDSSSKTFPKHSTPRGSPNQIRNSLGPVSSIFSSSSRLDKQFIPLSKHETTINSESGSHLCETIPENQESLVKSSNISCGIDNSCCTYRKSSILPHTHKLNHECIQHIDLPKDAPFDKVKKWQESLPSIDLLGSCSTANSDVSDCSLTNQCDDNLDLYKDVKMYSRQHVQTNIQDKQSKSNIQRCFKKIVKQDLNPPDMIEASNKHTVTNQAKVVDDQELSTHLSELSVSGCKKYDSSKSVAVCNEQNNNLCTNNCKTGNPLFKMSKSEQLSKCDNISHTSLKFNSCKQEPVKLQHSLKTSFESTGETSDDELSSYFPNSLSTTLSVDKNLKQLVRSEDSSSVSSSVLDSVNEFYSFVQKKSPKRKVNSVNYYSPCKIPKLIEPSDAKEKTDKPVRILKESRLSHLFPTSSAKVTENFQSVTKSDDNTWWKTSIHSQFKKSKNLQECLKHAEYFVSILAEGLKGIESTLEKCPKVQ